MSRLSIGVDIGTTQTKAVVFDEDGHVKTSCYKGYPLIQETQGMAEQDPEGIFQAVIYCLKTVVKSVFPQTIDVVSFSTAMHSLIVMDHRNIPLTRVITWADQRAEYTSEALKDTVTGQLLYERTGVPMHLMAPFHKIRWLKKTNPTCYQTASKFIGIKEYVFYRLFREYITDYSTASGTGFFNIHQLCWDEIALAMLELTEHKLPKLVAPTQQLPILGTPWIDILGITTDTIFIVGGADGPLSNLGLSVIEKGNATLTVGTSGAFRYIVDKPYIHPQAETFCYVLDESHWVIGGATSNGAGIFDWACENFMREYQNEAEKVGKNKYGAVLEKMINVPIGAQGLLFHPYLLGERAPLWDAEAVGAFIGLKRSHTEETMMRAVIEGICLNIKCIVSNLEQIAGPIQEVRATGGFSDSLEFKQIMANVLGMPLSFTTNTEASAFGAVLLGWKSIGRIASIKDAENFIQITERVIPESFAEDRYRVIYPLFLTTQKQIAASYHSLALLRKELEDE